MTSLTIDRLTKAFGAVTAVDSVSFKVQPGEMLVLVGPSGCGKTTCLRCLAGLETPTGGSIRIGHNVVTSIEEGIFVPPEKRQIGMVFQSYAVWPHMTVFENVAYPLRAMKTPKREIRSRVMETLKLVQLDALADRYSSQISGGQQQRVALARSLVGEPQLLLFDEPLSNLDANLRIQMRVEIRELQNRLGFTGVYVTHDQAEAMAVADRIAVMQGGILRQLDTPEGMYERPVNSFVAGFMGATNILEGDVERQDETDVLINLDCGVTARAHGKAQGRVRISVRPEAINLHAASPSDSGANVWPSTVSSVTYFGSALVYRIAVGAFDIEAHLRPTQRFAVGDQVFVEIDPDQCRLLADHSST